VLVGQVAQRSKDKLKLALIEEISIMRLYSRLKNFIKGVLPTSIVLLIEIALRVKRQQPFHVLTMEPSYNEDGMFTNHNCDFMQEPLFKAAYDLGFATESSNESHLHWRVYTACWLANRAKDLEGDFVECGTNKGMFARAIVHYTDFGNLAKKFYLVDTYRGLIEELQTEEEKKRQKFYYQDVEDTYQKVAETFSPFDNVIIVRGVIPDILANFEADDIAFLHIDMDSIAPEIAAIEHFWDKIISAGTILLNNYAYPGYEGNKKACDKFAESKDLTVLTLPTGQGLILKP
jgi:hypothetical protein